MKTVNCPWPHDPTGTSPAEEQRRSTPSDNAPSCSGSPPPERLIPVKEFFGDSVDQEDSYNNMRVERSRGTDQGVEPVLLPRIDL